MGATRADLIIMGRHLGNRWGGVYEVLRGVLEALEKLEAARDRRIEVLLPREGIETPGLRSVRRVVLGRWGRSRMLWDHVTVPAYARGRSGCVLYNPGIVLPMGLRIPAVVSIHDVAYFPRPELGGRGEYLVGEAWYMRRMIRRSVRKAAAVHVPSQSTRQEILRILPGTPAGRLHVWPYGVDAFRWAATDGNAGVWEALKGRGVKVPFVLYAGGLSRRKNVGVLVDAFESWRTRHPEMQLVLTGGTKRTRAEEGLETRMRPGESAGRIVRLGEVGEAELRVLYQRAFAMVYPSLYEGFGLPPLEAMAAGCPVICSKTTSLPEVVGPAARLIDAASPRELEDELERLTISGERERLIDGGRAWAATKGWKDMALNLIELADDLIQSSSG